MKKTMTGVLALVMVLVMVGCGQKDSGVVNGVAKDGATIGEGANIGAGSIFANYNGLVKNRSVIGAHARMGSAGIYVAPVTVGDGAYSGAGALIRKDVPAGALAYSETSQRTIEGWVLKNRAGTEPAEAAKAAGAQEPAES